MLDWTKIDTVFLDMDGTLLDLYFDNFFWLEHVPSRYAHVRGLDLELARCELLSRYRSIEGTLQWYCVDHWSRELDLDIAALKEEVADLISVHPHVPEFMAALAGQGKRRVLVTNAHQKALELKLRKTRLDLGLDRVLSSHAFGLAKESPGFWQQVHAVEPFDPERTLFIDDSLSVLRAAKGFGFRWLLAIAKPDSRAPARDVNEFPAIEDFSALLPSLLPVRSAQYDSADITRI
jgi:HAD superfamily hydrolase (TIGR01509 family)